MSSCVPIGHRVEIPYLDRGHFLTLVSGRTVGPREKLEVGASVETAGTLHSFYFVNLPVPGQRVAVPEDTLQLVGLKANGVEHLKKASPLLGLEVLRVTLPVTAPTVVLFNVKNPRRRSIRFALYAYLQVAWEACTP